MPHHKLQPSRDHVLIQYRDDKRGSAEASVRQPVVEPRLPAMVIAIGPGRKGRNGKVTPLRLSIGDRILVDKSRGIAIRLKDRSYAVIRERDLCAAS
jgi:chaperonin GroES